MKKIMLGIVSALLTLSLCSCGLLFPSDQKENGQQSSQEQVVTVHYSGDETKEYTVAKDATHVQCDFIAPSGQVIKGIYNKDGVQYAGYDCNILLSSNTKLPTDLYAKYENVDISYLDKDPFSALDEKPTVTSFYKSNTYTWEFNPEEYEDDQKMIAACLCNPYADLTITVTFYAKGDGTNQNNEFYSKLKVCDEEIGSFSQLNLGNDYAKYTYSGTIKALQLTNGDYKVKVSYGSTLGYEDHTVKNFKVDFKFNFGESN